MKRFFTPLLALLPLSAPAQDLPSQYAAALDSFYAGQMNDVTGRFEQHLAMLPLLEGDWLLTNHAFPDGDFTVEEAGSFCGTIADRIEQSGEMEFTMTRLRRGEPTPQVTTFAMAGVGFVFLADLEGMAEVYAFDDPNDPFRIPQLMSLSASSSGIAQVYLTAPDVMVVAKAMSMPEIYVRCP